MRGQQTRLLGCSILIKADIVFQNFQAEEWRIIIPATHDSKQLTSVEKHDVLK